jgi:hypothetical protein
MVEDGMILMYVKDELIYPVALTKEEHSLLQTLVKLFEPIKVINQPQGKALSLNKGVNKNDV